MLVRFLKRWRNYNGDEVAGFDDAMTQSLISGGFAEEFDPDADPAEAEDAEQGDGLPVQGGDADTLAGGAASPPARRRAGKAAAGLPVQGGDADTLAGGDDADTLAGEGTDADTVAGGEGAETLVGDGDDADTLAGEGTDADTVAGGDGAGA